MQNVEQGQLYASWWFATAIATAIATATMIMVEMSGNKSAKFED